MFDSHGRWSNKLHGWGGFTLVVDDQARAVSASALVLPSLPLKHAVFAYVACTSNATCAL
jgi:hypothetical protein